MLKTVQFVSLHYGGEGGMGVAVLVSGKSSNYKMSSFTTLPEHLSPNIHWIFSMLFKLLQLKLLRYCASCYWSEFRSIHINYTSCQKLTWVPTR